MEEVWVVKKFGFFENYVEDGVKKNVVNEIEIGMRIIFSVRSYIV